jgi:TfoX/Sxy family transcriptional regulator of competence genes
MSGSRELAEHARDLLAEIGGIELRRFFGGWALTQGGRQLGIVMDTVYLRADPMLAADLERCGAGRSFSYQTRRGTITVDAYRAVPDSALEQGGVLARLVRRAGQPVSKPQSESGTFRR